MVVGAAPKQPTHGLVIIRLLSPPVPARWHAIQAYPCNLVLQNCPGEPSPNRPSIARWLCPSLANATQLCAGRPLSSNTILECLPDCCCADVCSRKPTDSKSPEKPWKSVFIPPSTPATYPSLSPPAATYETWGPTQTPSSMPSPLPSAWDRRASKPLPLHLSYRKRPPFNPCPPY
jgi:hypothetical protein